MAVEPNQDGVFAALRAIAAQHADALATTADDDATYALERRERYRDKPTRPFVWIRNGKSYVSFHLFPIYEYPALLGGLSAELRGKMQGKSCFNFKRSQPALFEELADLTARCLTWAQARQ